VARSPALESSASGGPRIDADRYRDVCSVFALFGSADSRKIADRSCPGARIAPVPERVERILGHARSRQPERRDEASPGILVTISFEPSRGGHRCAELEGNSMISWLIGLVTGIVYDFIGFAARLKPEGEARRMKARWALSLGV
jgi:hypothetical protein